MAANDVSKAASSALWISMGIVFLKKWIFSDREFSKFARTYIFRYYAHQQITVSATGSRLSRYEAHFIETFAAAFLVTCHLLFNTICTQALAFTTKLLDSRKASDLNWNTFIWTLLPLAIFTSCSLILGNAAYIQLNVAAIHMLKALSPVLVCILLFLAGLANITWLKCIDITVISGGIVLASAGWGQPAIAGVAMQVASTSADAARLVVAQRALEAPSISMEPLVLLYHLAPLACMVSLVFTFAMVPPTPDDILENWQFLLGSCLLSFLLDLAGFSVVKKTSSLTLSICGILTDIIMIGLSVLIWHNTLGTLQIVGCGLAVAGILHHLQGTDLNK